MAEFICVLNKDTLIIKPHKKSPMLLRMMVLLFAMICGVLICSICLKQISNNTNIKLQDIQVLDRPPHDIGPQQLGIPWVHYPKPQTFSRDECAHNPVRFFAILSIQRSGSGWFETLLNSHINVSSNGEVFSKLERRQNASAIVNTLDKVYNLDWLSSASKNQCSAAVGLKWMLNQGVMAHHEAVSEYFSRQGVSVIFLFRRNLLRRMVSVIANSYDRYAKLLNGTHKSHVHSPEEADRLSKYQPSINSTSLIDDLKQMELTTAKALEYFNSTRHIVVYYEDLIKNRTILKDVQEFLRLPVMELTSRQVKIHKGSLSMHIKNWDDVNKTLNGTTYEKFLHADYR
ncbi:hypothetical protein HS088_TW14G00264 [Tripterygium wilfordii]|uniref:Sulfotransferase n=1 Tax=Tripterygium wilfordii TaxID=458696 RepID=A0A7J7CQ85_TRIWF|nr:nodulation protein H [Tripterygium wilfordii]XP_038722542.1 nodulation protein H [Tripterygium wilfordii]KAF5736129.1 hypothetical protein HS088_TW14G00264 [Tripterygium wilfordii]